jgi:uncharacterized repeat protein (TIGR01451 family)
VKEVCVREVQAKARMEPGHNGFQMQLRVAGAAALLLAAAWVTLASASHFGQSALTAVPASLQTVAAHASPVGLDPSFQIRNQAQNQNPVQNQARVVSALGSLPLMFEPNVGQSDRRVKFLASGVGSHGLGYGVFLTQQGATMSLLSRSESEKDAQSRTRVESLEMKLVGSNPQAHVSGISPLPGKSNYLIGNNPAQWHRDVPQFARVRYQDIYPGIDLVYYGTHRQMEYDFQIAPGSDPAQAELQFDGSKRMELKDGNLILYAEGGSIRLEAPRVYQRIGDRDHAVEGRFEMRAENRVGFALGAYDRSRELVIDPVIDYSTYFGGSGDEHSTSVAVDGGGNVYLTGSTTSPNLPITTGTIQSTLTGAQNVYVLKINATGNSIGYLTYLGGTGTDTPVGIAVGGSNTAYIAGTTSSTNFPTTAVNAYQSTPLPGSTGTTHVFVAALSSTGSTLNYSSYLSGTGTDTASGMAIDANGNVYITGTTTSTDSGASNDQFPASFPPEIQAYQQFSRAPIQFFVTKVNTSAFGIGSIPYSTYFGGGTPSNGIAVGGGIAVDSSGNIYFSGTTNFLYTGQSSSTDFPILNAYQPCLDQTPPTILVNPQTCTYSPTPTATDAFVAKLNPNLSTGSQLIWSTYLGGTGDDSSTGVAIDTGAANVYITGTTDSIDFAASASFAAYQVCLDTPVNPTTGTACVAPGTGTPPYATDAFVARVNNLAATTTTTTVLSLTYFSYLGGSGNDAGTAIAVDSANDALLTGWTQSTDFPLFPNATSNSQCTVTNSNDPCVLQGHLNTGGSPAQDAFFAHLNTTTVAGQNTTAAYVTYFGGSGADEGTGIAVDNNLNIYFAGDTNSPDLQTQTPLQSTNNGGYDAFVVKLGTEADLGVTGVITLPTSQSFVSAGNQATFTYTVTNSGPDLATQVTFSDDLSTAGIPLTFVSATAGSGSCSATVSNSTVVCTIASLQAGSTSTVTVVVTPTTSGGFNGGTVSVFSPGNNDPNPVNNTVNPPVAAQASDFTASITPANQSIPAAGDTAIYQVTITPSNPYANAIALTCCTNLPTGAAGKFSISSVTLTGTGSQSSQLDITTTSRPVTTTTASAKGLRQLYALWFSLPGMAVIGFGWKSGRRRRIAAAIAACILFGLISLQPACSGKTTATPVSGTPSGTYTLVGTATSGSDTKSMTFTLTVP